MTLDLEYTLVPMVKHGCFLYTMEDMELHISIGFFLVTETGFLFMAAGGDSQQHVHHIECDGFVVENGRVFLYNGEEYKAAITTYDDDELVEIGWSRYNKYLLTDAGKQYRKNMSEFMYSLVPEYNAKKEK